MDYRKKLPHSDEIETLQGKYERLWDELDIAFHDISSMKKELQFTKEFNSYLKTDLDKTMSQLSSLQYKVDTTNYSLNSLTNDFLKLKLKVNKDDTEPINININYKLIPIISIILCYVIYNLFYNKASI